jgi:DNA modification methylase
VRSFQDRWSGGIEKYLDWLNERVKQMYRVLKNTGSIFLHCDWHASAHIRVMILDKIFDRNLVNEIIWCYSGPANVKNRLAQKHDTIFFYSKTDKYFFDGDRIRLPYSEETVARTGRGASKTGIMANVKGDLSERHKNRLHEDGKYPEDYWTDIPRLQGNSSERIGYPTQKPYALLERIIKMASNKGDVVLDPFCGGGTTVAAADKLNRNWIGIDQSVQAIKVTELRLQTQTDIFTSLYANSYTLQLHKYDYDTLFNQNPYQFETWIIGQFGGAANKKQRNDFGLDGKMPDGTPIQVKQQENIGRVDIDKFKSAIERSDKKLFDKNKTENRPVGYFIAFSFGRGAVQEIARLKLEENIVIELVKVEDIVPIAKKPRIDVKIGELSRDFDMREIEFIATAKTDAGVEFFSWDFNYDEEKGFKAEVVIDKTGTQVHKFNAGEYNVAVKVIDTDGLEGLEIIKLKINGKIEKK